MTAAPVANGPRAAGVASLRIGMVVLALAGSSANRMNRRQVHDIKAHIPDPFESGGCIVQGAVRARDLARRIGGRTRTTPQTWLAADPRRLQWARFLRLRPGGHESGPVARPHRLARPPLRLAAGAWPSASVAPGPRSAHLRRIHAAVRRRHGARPAILRAERRPRPVARKRPARIRTGPPKLARKTHTDPEPAA